MSSSSNNTGVATTWVSGTSIGITGQSAGSATITVTCAATTNYNAASKTYAVSVALPKLACGVRMNFYKNSTKNTSIVSAVNNGSDVTLRTTYTTGADGDYNWMSNVALLCDLGAVSFSYTHTPSYSGTTTKTVTFSSDGKYYGLNNNASASSKSTYNPYNSIYTLHLNTYATSQDVTFNIPGYQPFTVHLRCSNN